MKLCENQNQRICEEVQEALRNLKDCNVELLDKRSPDVTTENLRWASHLKSIYEQALQIEPSSSRRRELRELAKDDLFWNSDVKV